MPHVVSNHLSICPSSIPEDDFHTSTPLQIGTLLFVDIVTYLCDNKGKTAQLTSDLGWPLGPGKHEPRPGPWTQPDTKTTDIIRDVIPCRVAVLWYHPWRRMTCNDTCLLQRVVSSGNVSISLSFSPPKRPKTKNHLHTHRSHRDCRLETRQSAGY